MGFTWDLLDETKKTHLRNDAWKTIRLPNLGFQPIFRENVKLPGVYNLMVGSNLKCLPFCQRQLPQVFFEHDYESIYYIRTIFDTGVKT